MLKDGLSGIMRIKNEATFLGPCIDSCIAALDELIVVYVDCTDETKHILELKTNEYPGKLKTFEYNYNVLWFDLTEKEFQYALDLPESSPRLYSSVCNYSLSKVQYKYVVKIDADQLYFTDEIKRWRDICANKTEKKHSLYYIAGMTFSLYLSLYRRISSKCGKVCLFMLPDWLVLLLKNAYHEYAKVQLIRGRAMVALSGVNVYEEDGEWYIPFDNINVHPPYNGEGDTVIFKKNDDTYFKRHPFNRTQNRSSYSVTEDFVSPCRRVVFAGLVWFHLHANRSYCKEKVKNVKKSHPELFIPIKKFSKMTYKEINNKMDWKVNTLYQRILFAFIHKMGINSIYKWNHLLNKQ